MSAVTRVKNISLLPSGKNVLFRHELLWPKIKKLPDFRLAMRHAEVFLVHPTDQIPFRRGNKAPVSPVYR